MKALIILALLLASAGAAAGDNMGPPALPEPGTLGLLAAGAFAAYRLRKKK